MAPLVLAGTVLTHLFGGSAGREGTAVQMGGSIASTIGKALRLDPSDTRTLLTCGIAAGFGAVFGTPFTGALFAVEVLAIGLVSFGSIVPCLIASVAGDWTTRALGIHHTSYHIGSIVQRHLVSRVPGLSWVMLAKVVIASIVFGLASVVFAELTHGLSRVFKWVMPVGYLRPAIGATLVIALAFAVGPDYLGLGVTADPNHPREVSILSCFQPGGATYLSWWWKTLFTAVTLSCGFKGGEVTPLFFVGAALGNAMARLLHAPVDLFAGLGFVAVFAGATNTPLTCTIMGIELFAGSQADLLNGGFVVYLATACFVAYLMSGHSGIYLSQRIGHPKGTWTDGPVDADLRAARERAPMLGATLLGGSVSAPVHAERNEPQTDTDEYRSSRKEPV
jgi:H+/Cl- antiporter ClcA